MFRVVITPGDTDGIGLEVAMGALKRRRPHRKVHFSIWCNSSQRQALVGLGTRSDLSFIVSDEPPPVWVEESARLCLNGQADALVTGPISKTLIHASGLKDIGHTEIFRRICGVNETFMAFLGPHANVVLLTDHLPIRHVPRILTPEKIKSGIEASMKLAKRLRPTPLGRVAVLGLNPHAGESGLIGREEVDLFDRVIRRLRKRGAKVDGPFSADGFFAAGRHSSYSVVLAAYHDQGLIPFKLLHGFNKGVHLTLGLPFIRTSVDHGTAKELFGKGVADSGSMGDAIDWAIRLGGLQ